MWRDAVSTLLLLSLCCATSVGAPRLIGLTNVFQKSSSRGGAAQWISQLTICTTCTGLALQQQSNSAHV